jgi:intein-encoded DNA endonuclease-like protein
VPIYKKVNKKFFEKWSSEMAYVLGFIFADGNIICTKRNTWFLSIQITDKKILEQIKNTLNSSHTISKRKRGQNHKQLYRLQIGSKDICKDLSNLGLTERKSKTIVFPNIPKKYLFDFIRGYFDGDGGVWVGLKNKKHDNKNIIISTSFTSGCENFLISLKKILAENGLLGGSLVKKERGFDLKYSIKDSLKLYKNMYNDSCPLFLSRKKERFEKYIKMRL